MSALVMIRIKQLLYTISNPVTHDYKLIQISWRGLPIILAYLCARMRSDQPIELSRKDLERFKRGYQKVRQTS